MVEISDDLNFKMSQPINAQLSNYTTLITTTTTTTTTTTATLLDINCKNIVKSTQKQNEITKPMSCSLVSMTNQQIQYCGPYKLEKTLGKGQTG